jgi:cytochrome c
MSTDFNSRRKTMKLKLALLAAAGVALSTPGYGAVDAKKADELMKASGCLACHAIDKKLVGPGYKEVAAKYKADKGAAASLAEKVKKGGSGVWGQVPMPPNPAVKDEDIKTMVEYILSL